jgi:hypothetical protein
MSDCGVCIGGDFDCDDSESFYFVHRTTIKPQVCDECGCKIKGGELHEYAQWRQDGKQQSAHSCELCAEIAWAFMCDQRCYFVLWDRMEDVFVNFSQACLDRLKTPTAKAEVQRRWMKWKGLALPEEEKGMEK